MTKLPFLTSVPCGHGVINKGQRKGISGDEGNNCGYQHGFMEG